MPLLKTLLPRAKAKRSDIGHIRYYATLVNTMDAITVELKASGCTDPKHHAIVEFYRAMEYWYYADSVFHSCVSVADLNSH